MPEQSSAAAGENAPWGPRQGLMLLGGAIMAVGLGIATFLFARLPPEPGANPQELAELQQLIDGIQPSQIFEIWDRQFRVGIGMPLTETQDVYRHLLAERRVKLTIALVFAGFGLAMVGAGALYKREESSQIRLNRRQPTAAGPTP